MFNFSKSLPVLMVLGFGLAACGNNGGTVRLTPQPQTQSYTQIERLSRPAIKEVFENFSDHQKSNAVEPYADTLLQTDIQQTEDFVRYDNPAGPSSGPDYGKVLQSVLYPDEYTVDLSQTTGGFLGVETAGAVGGTFGGRNPNDDVIGVELAALFGTALSDLKIVPADNKQNGCLSTQNLSSAPYAAQASGPAFPYLHGPH